MRRFKHLRRAMTFAELMLALTIVAMAGAATAGMMLSAANTSKYMNASGDAVWSIDNAQRRIMHNLRACSSLDTPTSTTLTHSFSVHTQPDAGNGNTTYSVSYALSGTDLQETDTRYGTNTIASNVTAFNVAAISLTSPITVQITITIGTATPTTRTFIVLCRNL